MNVVDKNIEKIHKRLKKEKPINCPKCSVGRKKVVMEKIVSPNNQFIIDECPDCGGRFLDKQEIGHMKKMTLWQYIKLWFQNN